MTDQRRFEFRYPFTRRDYAAFVRHTMIEGSHVARVRRTSARQRWVAMVGVSVLGTISVFMMFNREYGTMIATGLPVVLLVYWIFSDPVRAWSRSMQLWSKKLSESAAGGYHEGEHRLQVSAEGIDLDEPHHRTHQRWSGVVAVEESPDHVFLVRLDSSAITVPASVLGSAMRSEFVSACRDWIRTGGGVAVARHLESNDATCLSCLYNLRGVRTGTCPECGTPINHRELKIRADEAKG
jgi:hypothetical protein